MTLLFTPGCYYYVRRPCSLLVSKQRGRVGRASGGGLHYLHRATLPNLDVSALPFLSLMPPLGVGHRRSGDTVEHTQAGIQVPTST